MTISKLIVTLGVQKNHLAAGLRSAGQMLKSFASKGKAFAQSFLGASIIMKGVGMLKDALVGLGDEVKRLKANAEAIGTDTEFIQRWEGAARRTGVETQEATVALRELSRRAGEAFMGFGEGVATFKQLGISVADQNGMLKSTPQLVQEISDKLGSLPDDASKVAIANKLMAESGYKALAFMGKGAEELNALMEDTNVITNENAESIREAYIMWDKFIEFVKAGFGNIIGQALDWVRAWDRAAGSIENGVRKMGAFKAMLNNIIAMAKLLKKVFVDNLFTMDDGAANAAAWKEYKESIVEVNRLGDGQIKQQKRLIEMERKLEERQKARAQAEAKAAQEAVKGSDDRLKAYTKEKTALESALKKAQDAQTSLATQQHDRRYSSLSEIAGMTPANRFGLMQKQRAQYVMNLESFGKFAQASGADSKFVDQIFSRADEARKGIVGLSEKDRDPMSVMSKSTEVAAKKLEELATLAQGNGLNINPKTGR